MILVKVLTSILLLLAFVHALPSTFEGVDDTSIQRINLVVRQTTTTPVSVAATGPESLNLTDLVDTFEGLAIDLEGVGGVLRNLTETLKADISDVSTNVLLFLSTGLKELIGILTMLLQSIQEISSGSDLPNGLREIFNAFLESLKSLLESLENLGDALSDFSAEDLNSLRNLFKALQGAVNALIKAVGASVAFFLAAEAFGKVPAGESDEVLNDLTRLLSDVGGLERVLGSLGELLGLSP